MTAGSARAKASLIAIVALVAGFAGFAAALAGCTGRDGPVHGVLEANAVVVRHVDGDTLVARIGPDEEKVRLIGIDTPETVDPRQPAQCFGKEASRHLAELVPEGTSLRLEVDEEPRDRYGRLLVYVYRASDGLFVNLDMVEQGYANTLSIAPNLTHRDRFSEAERTARTEGRGLWSNCPADG